MQIKKIGLTVLLAFGLTGFSATIASAAQSQEVCISYYYDCVAPYNYVGEDIYGVYTYNLPTTSTNGTRHSCTSFVAFMLARNNPWMPAITFFNDAEFWDTQAVTRVGATIVSTPKIGDIAQWEKNPARPKDVGHVGYVSFVSSNLSDHINYIEVIDDNGGRNVTTRKILLPQETTGTIRWPDHFIRFPERASSSGGGGFIDRVPAIITIDENSSLDIAP
jgi:hypothetical protein